MNTTITFTTTPIPMNVASRPTSLLKAAVVARSMTISELGASLQCVQRRLVMEPTNGEGQRVVAFKGRWRIASQGEVPERLNGRDWKSRNGGDLVRGFESLPLRADLLGQGAA
jgi:hypothetical protein